MTLLNISSGTILLLLFITLSCRENPPGPRPYTKSISLSAEDIGVAVATLQIGITDTTLPFDLGIKRNGNLIVILVHPLRKSLNWTDSTLLRAHEYFYRAYLLDSVMHARDSSNLMSISTVDSASIFLQSTYVELTDAEFKLSIPDRNPLRGYRFTSGGRIISSGYLMGDDSTLVDTGLAPTHTYTYKIYRLGTDASEQPIDSSSEVSINTLDTTRHKVSWEVDTLGTLTMEATDVSIIDYNEVWVTGRFCSPATGTCNIAKWDGSGWTYDLIPFSTCAEGGDSIDYPETWAIFKFSPTNIWITNGGEFVQWDGEKFLRPCRVGQYQLHGYLLKMWGSSPTDLYAVGRGGSIIHYNGTQWSSMESGTTTDLTDVWGSPDGSVVWACGWIDSQPTVLLRLHRGGTWETVYENGANLSSYSRYEFSGAILSVWTNNITHVDALTWYDLYRAPEDTHGNSYGLWGVGNGQLWTDAGVNRVRGTGVNDLFCISWPGRVWHFNGASWHRYLSLERTSDFLCSVDVSPDLIAIVGSRHYDSIHYYGLVYLGRR